MVPNGGVGYKTCSEVNQARYKNGMSILGIVPESSVAIRDDHYKLVRNESVVYVPETDGFTLQRTEEFFQGRRIAHDWGLSSVYDFMVDGVFDGLTNSVDAAVIQNNLGKVCERSYGVY